MAKYIDAEKLKAEIKRQKHELELSIQSQGDYGQSCHIVAYDNILSLINSLQQEQPETDKSLEEAAEKQAKEYSDGIIDPKDALMCEAAYESGMFAGAGWQKEQMMKEAKDGYVSAIIIHSDGDEEHYAVTYPNGERPHSIMDKIKIIIL